MTTKLETEGGAKYEAWIAERPDLRARYSAREAFIVGFSYGIEAGMDRSLALLKEQKP